jgi:hypothetical protein
VIRSGLTPTIVTFCGPTRTWPFEDAGAGSGDPAQAQFLTGGQVGLDDGGFPDDAPPVLAGLGGADRAPVAPFDAAGQGPFDRDGRAGVVAVLLGGAGRGDGERLAGEVAVEAVDLAQHLARGDLAAGRGDEADVIEFAAGPAAEERRDGVLGRLRRAGGEPAGGGEQQCGQAGGGAAHEDPLGG